MKKIILLIIIVLLTGCSTKHITCTMDKENESMDYTLNAKYDIYYKGKYVTKVVKKETYSTVNKDTYNYLSKAKDLEYSMLNSAYGGYNYKIDLIDNSVIINTTIKIKDLDVEKLVSDKKIDKYYTAKEKILLSGLKRHYEEKGAICE